jgi:hypothetical protein
MVERQPPVTIKKDGRTTPEFRRAAGERARARWSDPVRKARMLRLCMDCFNAGVRRGRCPHPVGGRDEIVEISKLVGMLHQMVADRQAGKEDWDHTRATIACQTIVVLGERVPRLKPWERQHWDGSFEEGS